MLCKAPGNLEKPHLLRFPLGQQLIVLSILGRERGLGGQRLPGCGNGRARVRFWRGCAVRQWLLWRRYELGRLHNWRKRCRQHSAPCSLAPALARRVHVIRLRRSY